MSEEFLGSGKIGACSGSVILVPSHKGSLSCDVLYVGVFELTELCVILQKILLFWKL